MADIRPDGAQGHTPEFGVVQPSEGGVLPAGELESRTVLGHPPGLFLLFLVEMWERFSYYGMRALLMLYLIAVTSVHQLQPGAYTNVLEFTETPSPAAAAAPTSTPQAAGDRPRQQISIAIAVDQPGFTPSPASVATSQGDPLLRVVRLRRGESQPGTTAGTWVTDERPDAPLSLAVQRGVRPGDSEFAFEVLNPTDQPIRCSIEIRRDQPDPRTFFTINGSTSAVTAEIKPDSQRAAGEGPYRVVLATNNHDSGRNWLRSDASVLYGWYTGLAYLFPILGGIIADKLIGTHRSMLAGGILISIGHVILGVSGFGDLAHSTAGMALFITGLAVIVLGTGHFKPTVSVMVGQLYKQGDPRRDGAFTIFYMGINLGAFICAFVCGTLGEKVGWHWGFGSAAVGMIFGLLLYMFGRPVYLKGIGEAPRSNAGPMTLVFMAASLVVSGLVGLAYYQGVGGTLADALDALAQNQRLSIALVSGMTLGILAWVAWFVASNPKEDRGPVITIFVFMLFNAFFWVAFEQAGSSLNVFTEQNTDRMLLGFEVPATWFQSVNAGLIFMLAPLFAMAWTSLGRRKLNPTQPVKIALGLIFLGIGYLFMVVAGKIVIGGAAKAGMFFILATYFWHTVGELCLSPTGLSYVTKAAPAKFVSLLMGIWFVSSFIANLGGGLIAAQVERIERGELKMWWDFGGQADFFFLFVVTSIGAGVLILILTPLLKKLMRSTTD